MSVKDGKKQKILVINSVGIAIRCVWLQGPDSTYADWLISIVSLKEKTGNIWTITYNLELRNLQNGRTVGKGFTARCEKLKKKLDSANPAMEELEYSSIADRMLGPYAL